VFPQTSPDWLACRREETGGVYACQLWNAAWAFPLFRVQPWCFSRRHLAPAAVAHTRDDPFLPVFL